LFPRAGSPTTSASQASWGWGPRALPGHDFLGRDALTSMLGDGELPDQVDVTSR
jgi:hypothetical protein